SPDRIESLCAISDRCGGCPLIRLGASAQRALKLGRLKRAIAGLGMPALEPTFDETESAFGYRRRARFGFRKVGRGIVLGYFAHGSHRLIDVERCPVISPQLDRALAQLREALSPWLTGSGEIELFELANDAVSASVHCDVIAPPELYRAAEALAAQTPFVHVSVRVEDGAPARFGRALSHADGLDGASLRTPVEGFAQINAAMNARLGRYVSELAEARAARVIELYAGHGNFSVLLARDAAAFCAVEGDAASAAACRDNLRERGLRDARVIASDVATARLPDRADVIVLDPPRAGAVDLGRIAERTHAARVVYVSCHMTTLQRDLRALHAVGYRVDRAVALDMFPQTAHVEAVVRLRRA
ncbi:MAG TPA: methyltransferase, partial [Polyangiales bacterium]|nr:methyltransferase [Polyangiales bacterium]